MNSQRWCLGQLVTWGWHSLQKKIQEKEWVHEFDFVEGLHSLYLLEALYVSEALCVSFLNVQKTGILIPTSYRMAVRMR